MVEKYSRILRHIALLLGLVLVWVTPVSAAHADPLIPPRPQSTAVYGKLPPLYDDDRFDPWSYTFEGQEWSSSGYVVIYFWMNELLIAKAWLLKFAFRMVEYSVTDLLFQPFVGKADAGLRAVGNSLWNGRAPLFVTGLALCALWALMLYGRGRVSRAWAALGGSAVVLVSTAIILTTGGTLAAAALETGHGLANQVYSAVQGIGQDGDLLANSGDGVWRTMVYEPWLTGELSEKGQTDYRSDDGLNGGQFLAFAVEERRSVCLYNASAAEVCPWWAVDFLPRRMFLTLWTSFAAVIYGGTLIVLAGGILLAQVAVLFCLLTLPILLLTSLWWPEGGGRLLRRTLDLVLSGLLRQVLLSAMLAALLLFSQQVRSQLADFGWMLQSVVLILLAGAAFRFRYEWLHNSASLVRRGHREPVEKRGGVQGWIRDQSRKAAPAEGAAAVAEQVANYSTLHVPTEALQQHLVEALRMDTTASPDAAENQSLAFQREVRVLQLRLRNRESTFSEWAQGASDEHSPLRAASQGTEQTRSRGDDLAALTLQRSGPSQSVVSKPYAK